jgi:hypothetical protein
VGVFSVLVFGQESLRVPIRKRADGLSLGRSDPIEGCKQFAQLGLSPHELPEQFELERRAHLDGELAAEPVGCGWKEVERRGQDLIQLVALVELEHRHDVDREGLKRQRDVDPEITPSAIGKIPGRSDPSEVRVIPL